MAPSTFQLWSGFAKEAFDASVLIFKFFCFLHVTRTHIFNIAFVSGASMLPTISMTGDVVLVDHISTRRGKVRRGDIILIRSPENPRKIVTKRLIGIEGDRVTFVIDPKNSDKCENITVPKGHVWLQGDNIYESRDSRCFGAVPYGLLQGRVFWRVWPPKDFGSL
ncbi:hypothetical protein Ancab_018302 [Ancistrocladus abbreviatus]